MSRFRRYNELEIGQSFPDRPVIFHVDWQTIAAFGQISADASLEGSPARGLVAPPMLAAIYIRPAQNALNGPPGGVHAKQGFEFHAPIEAGDTLSTTLTVAEKYERKGRRYLVCETRTDNQDGVVVSTGRIVQIWGNEDA